MSDSAHEEHNAHAGGESDKFAPVYEKYRHLPPAAKKRFNSFMEEHYKNGAPSAQQMEHDLEKIVQESSHSNISDGHSAAGHSHKSGRLKYAAGLALLIGGISMLAGMPYIPSVY